MSLNEALHRALLTAADPSALDEEPLDLRDKNTNTDDDNNVRGGVAAVVHEDDDDVSMDHQSYLPSDDRMMRAEQESLGLQTRIDPADVAQRSADVTDRCRYIPLRLSYEERKSLRLVVAAINVSDYTSVVDAEFKNKARRGHQQLQHMVAFFTGIVASQAYKDGQTLLEDRNFAASAPMLRSLLEVVRRYKITNPEKLRSEYGKLLYLMQDARSEAMSPLIGVNVLAPVRTVYGLLESKGGLALLGDGRLAVATQEVLPDPSKSRSVIQSEIRRKEKTVAALCRDYSSSSLSADDIRHCLHSICDNESFLNSSLLPIKQCIGLLVTHFHPNTVSARWSLGINEGDTGARLSHSHEVQYCYVLQSLHLWAAIVEDMFRLWSLAEDDMLSDSSGSSYELRQTGQGLQRVQQSPRVYRCMHEILALTKSRLQGSSWIGSSVIHLGDHNVPNALIFIDKYTQVSRILAPLVRTMANLQTVCDENEGIRRYIATAYGGVHEARMGVLRDFFRHAFDGSGGDNFYDAGSCIDGRLTSAWNWCSQLPSKSYYGIFKLTGFLSFDGEFDK